MFSFDFARWLKSWLHPRARTCRRKERYRLSIDRLEDRLAPTTYTWSGTGGAANDNWSNAANWGGQALTAATPAPVDLVFNSNAAYFTANDDLAGLTVSTITIAAPPPAYGANVYTIQASAGVTLNLTGSINDQSGNAPAAAPFGDTIAIPLQMTGAGGSAQDLTVGAGTTLTLAGAISGSSGSYLSKEGDGLLILSANNGGFNGSFTLDHDSGIVQVENAFALGSAAAPNVVTVENNSEIDLVSPGGSGTAIPGGPIQNTVELFGFGAANNGALANVLGTNTWSGNVVLENNASFYTPTGAPDSFTISGVISDTGSGDSLTKGGIGQLILTNANTYRGQTQINDGTLTIENPLALGAVPSAGTSTNANPASLVRQGSLQLEFIAPVFPAVPANSQYYILGNPAQPYSAANPYVGFVVPDYTLDLAGTGFNGNFTLDNFSGDNAWSGPVILAGAANGNVNVQVDDVAGVQTQLDITGVISDANPANPAQFNKVDNFPLTSEGNLILEPTIHNATIDLGNTYKLVTLPGGFVDLAQFTGTGTANTYLGATGVGFLNGGTITLEDSQGLGPTTKTAVNSVGQGSSINLVANVGHIDSVTGTTNHLLVDAEVSLNGPGYQINGLDGGTIHSISGINTWGPNAAYDAANPAKPYAIYVTVFGGSIGVEPDPSETSNNNYFTNDYSLTITGGIGDDNLSLVAGTDPLALTLTKVDAGQLILPTANPYLYIHWVIQQGWVTVQDPLSLGGEQNGAGLDIAQGAYFNTTVDSGAALMLRPLYSNTNMSINGNLILEGTGITNAFPLIDNMGALENLEGVNTFAGNITLIGQAGIGVEQVDPTILSSLVLSGQINQAQTPALFNAPAPPANIAIPSTFGTGGVSQYTQLVDTGSSQGSLVINYRKFVNDDLRVYYGAIGTPGSSLIYDSGNITGTGATPAINFGPGPGTQIEIVIDKGVVGPNIAWSYKGTVTVSAGYFTGGLIKLGSQRLVLEGNGTYQGGVDIRQGIVVDDNDAALGTPLNTGAPGQSFGTTVEAGAALVLSPTVANLNGGISDGTDTWSAPLTLNGSGNSTFGFAPLAVLSDDNLWSGPITLNADLTIAYQGALGDEALPADPIVANFTNAGTGLPTLAGTTPTAEVTQSTPGSAAAGLSDVETLTFGGVVTGGTFTLTVWDGAGFFTTGNITWVPDQTTLIQAIQAALNLDPKLVNNYGVSSVSPTINIAPNAALNVTGDINDGTTAVSPLIHSYTFTGPTASYNDTVGAIPITPVGGSITAAGYTWTTAVFPNNQGLTLPAAVFSNPANYTIQMDFDFTDVNPAAFGGTGYDRIINYDVTPQTSANADNGLYTLADGGPGAALTAYPSGTSGPNNAFLNNVPVDLIVTRDAATGNVQAYVNGVAQFLPFGFNDAPAFPAGNEFVLQGALLKFFIDDDFVPNEVSAGTATAIKIYNRPLTAAEVAIVAAGGTLGSSTPPPADLIVAGGGELSLSGNNTYRGTTVVNQGIVTVADNQALGTTGVPGEQTLTLSNPVAGVTQFNLSFGAASTLTPITYTGTAADAANIQSALEGLATIGTNVTVIEENPGEFLVTFSGFLAGTEQLLGASIAGGGFAGTAIMTGPEGGTQVADGAQIQLQNSVTIAGEPLTIQGSGSNAESEEQTFVVSTDQTGAFSGAYDLTFAGATTAALPYNASAAQIEAALDGLPTIGAVAGEVAVNLTNAAAGSNDSQTIFIPTNAEATTFKLQFGPTPYDPATYTTAAINTSASFFTDEINIRNALDLLANVDGTDGVGGLAGASAVFSAAGITVTVSFAGGLANDPSLPTLEVVNQAAGSPIVVKAHTPGSTPALTFQVTFGGSFAGLSQPLLTATALSGTTTVSTPALKLAGGSANATPKQWVSLAQGSGATPTMIDNTAVYNDGGAVTENAAGPVTSVAVDPTDPDVIYIATAGGGAWRTQNGGLSWQPLFDAALEGSSPALLFGGVIAVDPAHIGDLYYGTGAATTATDSYAGSGVYFSTNSGETWTLLTDPVLGNPFAGLAINQIVINDPGGNTPDTIAVAASDMKDGTGTTLTVNGATGNAGVWLWNNGAWTNTTKGVVAPTNGVTLPSINADWSDLYFDGNTLFAALSSQASTAADGVYSVANFFTTAGPWAWDVSSAPGPIGTYVTGSGGDTELAGNGPNSVLAANANPGNVGIAQIQEFTLGTGWSTLANLPPGMPGNLPADYLDGLGQEAAYANAIFEDAAGNIFVGGTDPGVPGGGGGKNFVLEDSGGVWSDIVGDSPTGPMSSVHAFSETSTGVLVVATDGGVWTYNLATTTWTDITGNLADSEIYSVTTDPDNSNVVLAAGHSIGLTRYTLSAAGTQDWTQVAGGADFTLGGPGDPSDGGQVSFSATDPNFALFYDAAGLGTGLQTSANTGQTWTSTNVYGAPPPLYAPFAIDANNPQRYVVAGTGLGGGPLNETINGGATYYSLNSPIFNITSVALPEYQGAYQPDPSFTGLNVFASNHLDTRTVYIAGTTLPGNSPALYVTKDDGGHWSPNRAPTALLRPGAEITDVIVDPGDRDTIFITTSNLSGHGGQVLESTDAGQDWTDISAGLPIDSCWTLALDPRTNDLYVGTDIGVYKLAGGAGTWTKFGVGLPNVMVDDLDLNTTSNILTIATYGRGVYQIYLDDTSANAGALRAVAGTDFWTGPIYLDGPTTISANGSQNLQNGLSGATLNIIGPISDAGSTPLADTLTKIGGGDVVLAGANTYAGATLVQQGNLVVESPSALGTGGVAGSEVLVFNDAVAGFTQYDLSFNGVSTPAPLTYQGNAGDAAAIQAALQSLSSVGANNVTVTTAGANIFLLTFANGLAGTPFLATASIVGGTDGSSYAAVAGATVVAAGAALELQSSLDNEPITLNGNGIEPPYDGHYTGALVNVTNNNTYTGTLTLATDSTIGVAAGQLTIAPAGAADGIVDGGTAATAYSLDKEGSGPLVLAGPDSYQGGTTVNVGAVNVQNSLALGAAGSAIVVTDGAQLQLQGSAAGTPGVDIVGDSLYLSGTGLTNDGALRNVVGDNTWAGPITLSTVPQYSIASTPEGVVAFAVANANDALSLTGNINEGPPIGTPVLSPALAVTAGAGLAPGTYYYVVTAVTPVGESLVSNVQSFVATVAKPQVTLSWSQVAGALGYRIYRSSVAGNYADTLLATITSGQTLTYTDLGFAAGAGTPNPAVPSGLADIGPGTLVLAGANTYTGGTYIGYVFGTTNASGVSTPASVGSGGVNGGVIDVQSPGALGNNQGNEIQRIVTSEPVNQANTFTLGVDGQTTGNLTYGATGSLAAGPTQNTPTTSIGGALAANTTYYYVITANINGVASGPSNEQSVTTTAANETVNLSWTAVPNASSYNVYRTTVAGNYTSPALKFSAVVGLASADNALVLTAGGLTNTVQSALNALSSVAGTPTGQVATVSSSTLYNGLNEVESLALTNPVSPLNVPSGFGVALASGGSLAPSTTYYYEVTAVTPLGESVPTAQASVITTTRAVGNLSVQLAWTAVAGASSYRIYRSTVSDNFTNSFLASVTGTTYADLGATLASPILAGPIAGAGGGGLAIGTTYDYIVTAFNAGGETFAGNQQSFTATVADQTAVLTWNQVAGAAGYNVYRSTNAGVFTNALLATIPSGATITYHDVGATTGAGTANLLRAPTLNAGGALSVGTTYYYQVSALNANGVEEFISNQQAVTIATAGTQSVGLAWSAVPGATGYRIYRSTATGDFSNSLIAAITSGATTTYTDSGSTLATLAVSGTISAGTFELTIDGLTTGTINATLTGAALATQVQARIDALGVLFTTATAYVNASGNITINFGANLTTPTMTLTPTGVTGGALTLTSTVASFTPPAQTQFTLTFLNVNTGVTATTPPIAYLGVGGAGPGSDAANIQAVFNALTNVGPAGGAVIVTPDASDTVFTITFVGAFTDEAQALISPIVTQGTASAAVTETTPGTGGEFFIYTVTFAGVPLKGTAQPLIVATSNSNALTVGASETATGGIGTLVYDGSALQVDGDPLQTALPGGITLPVGDNLDLNGSGPTGAGALVNVTGNNTWQGNVVLQSSSTIAADATTELTLSGLVQETPLSAADPVPTAQPPALTKAGVGTVVLAPASQIVALTGAVSNLNEPTLNGLTTSAGGSLSPIPYYYEITAIGPDGETLPSSQETATPTVGQQTIDLTWPAYNGAVGYRIYRTTTAGVYGPTSLLADINSGATVAYADNGLTPLSAGTPPLQTQFTLAIGPDVTGPITYSGTTGVGGATDVQIQTALTALLSAAYPGVTATVQALSVTAFSVTFAGPAVAPLVAALSPGAAGFVAVNTNTYTGNTYVNAGILNIQAAQALGVNTSAVQEVSVSGSSGSFSLTFDGQTTGALSYGLPASGGASATASVANALDALSNIGPDGVTVTQTGNNYFVYFNSPGLAFVPQNMLTYTIVTAGISSVTISEPLPGGASGIDVAAGATLQMQSNAVAQNFTEASGKPLTLDGTGYLNLGALDDAAGTTAYSFAPITLAGNTSIGADAGGVLNLDQPLSGVGDSVTKVGAGVVQFNAGNAYTGLTDVHQGTLKLDDTGAGLAAPANLQVGDDTPSYQVQTLTFTGGAAPQLGDLFMLTYGAATTGNITYYTNAAYEALQIQNALNAALGAGYVSVAPAAPGAFLVTFVGLGTGNPAAVISGSDSVTAGVVIASSITSPGGGAVAGTAVAQWEASNQTAPAAVAFVNPDGVLDLNNNSQTLGQLTILSGTATTGAGAAGGALTVNGPVVISAGGTLALPGVGSNVHINGSLSLNASSVNLTGQNSQVVVTGNMSLLNSSANLTAQNSQLDAGSMTLLDSSVNLTGPNSQAVVTGAFNMTAGSVNLTGAGSSMTLDNGVTLTSDGTGSADIAGQGSLVLNSAAPVLLVNHSLQTFDAVITAPIAAGAADVAQTVTKSGAGRLELAAQSTYTAATTIFQGNVQVDPVIQLNLSALTVGNTFTLTYANGTQTSAPTANITYAAAANVTAADILAKLLSVLDAILAPGSFLIAVNPAPLSTTLFDIAFTGAAATGAVQLSSSAALGINQVNDIGPVALNGSTATTLSGTGAVGALTTGTGTVNPGNTSAALNTGVLNASGNVTWTAGTTFAVNLTTTGAPEAFNVAGNINLGGANLTGTAAPNIPIGQSYTIINYTGTLTNKFAEPDSPNTIFISGEKFTVNYGTPHEVILTRALDVLANPNGFVVQSSANPSVYGQDVTFTATLTPEPGAVLPTSGLTVKFVLDSAGTPVTETVPVVVAGNVGTASFDPQVFAGFSWATGTHTVDATFQDTNVPAVFQSANLAPTFDQTVSLNTVTVSNFAANPASPTYGQAVLLTATVLPGTPLATSGAVNPTGNVQFIIDPGPSQQIFTGVLTSAAPPGAETAQVTIPALAFPAGAQTVAVAYVGTSPADVGDANFSAGTTDFALAYQPDSSTTTFTSVPAATNYGQNATFTVRVTPGLGGAGVPTGNVDFYDGSLANPIGSIPYAGGTANFSLATLPAGLHGDIIAQFVPSNGNYIGSSTSASFTVNPGPTAVSFVSATPGSPIFGQPVAFVIAVASNDVPAVNPLFFGYPAGTVTLWDGAPGVGVNLGSGTLSSGQVTISSSLLSEGTHNDINAVFTATGNYAGSVSTLGGFVVAAVPTATTVSANPANPPGAAFGQAVILTATVTAGGVTIPVGSQVQFTDTTSGLELGIGLIGAGGTASITTNTAATNLLALGAHSIIATYTDTVDTNFAPSTGPVGGLPYTINPANTTVAVSANPGSPPGAVFGLSVALTATVTSPTGGLPPVGAGSNVVFVDSTTGLTLGNANLNAAGQATIATSSLSVATHLLTATYTDSADGDFVGNSGTLSNYIVSSALTNTSVSAAPASGDVYGTAVTLTALVTSPTATVSDGGTVTFIDTTTGTLLGVATLAGGSASITTTATTLSATTHTITATYADTVDGNFAGSTGTLTPGYVVAPAPTATAVSANPTTGNGLYGQAILLTATVTSGLLTIPVGSQVVFVDTTTGAKLGTVFTVAGGVARLTTSALGGGTHDIVATFTDTVDTNFAGSSGALNGYSVNPAPTSVTLSAAPFGGAFFGEAVTLTATVASSVPAPPIGTSVTFVDATTGITLGTGTIGASRQTSISTTGLAGGANDITATYLDTVDGNYASSSFTLTGYFVTQAATTTTVVANPVGGSRFGQAVTLTAGVGAGQGAVPVGSQVTFNDVNTGATLGVALIGAGGSASITTSALIVGTHSITATYLDTIDSDYAGSTGTLKGFAVVAVGTTTTVSALPASGDVFGESISLTATVSAGGLTIPIGSSVTFIDSTTGANLGTGTIGAGGTATITTNALTAANHTIAATYADTVDGNFFGSSGSLTNYTVSAANTAITAFSASLPTTVVGQTVTLSATVVVQNPSLPSVLVNAGSVTFIDTTTGINLGTAGVNASGVANLNVSFSVANQDTISAQYTGSSPTFAASAAVTMPETIRKFSKVNVNPISGASFGAPAALNYSVSVTGTPGTPSGAITVTDTTTATIYGPFTLNAAGAVTIPLAGLSAGSHSLQFAYSGDLVGAGFAAASTTITQVVNSAATTTTLSPTAAAHFGQAITLTATVTSPGGVPLDGVVTFKDSVSGILGAANLGPGNTATFTTTAIQLAVGSHSITASYGGSIATTDFAPSLVSAAKIQTVSAATTQTVLTPLTASTYGNQVTFTATVNPTSAGSTGIPTSGTVTFRDVTLGKILGTFTLTAISGNVASVTTTATQLTVGNHSITATYGGSADFAASLASTAATQTIAKAATQVFVTPSLGSGALSFGQAVTLTAAVSLASGGSPGTPTGTVSFVDSTTGVTLGSAALNAVTGLASLTTSALSANIGAGHTITANYVSTNANIAGTSGTLTNYLVNPASTTIKVTPSSANWSLGQTVSFKVAVASTTTGTPTGTVILTIDTPTGTTNLPAQTLAAGATTFFYAFPTSITGANIYTVTTTYTPTASPAPTNAVNFAGNSLTLNPQSVLKASAISVSAAANPATVGVALNLYATLTGTGIQANTGVVEFYDNGVLLGAGAILSSTANSVTYVLNWTFTAAVTNSITASFSGDATFNPAGPSAPLALGVKAKAVGRLV